MLNAGVITRREMKADRMLPFIESDPDSIGARLRRFVKLEKERRELESRLKLIEQEEATLKETIGDELEELKMQGIKPNANIDGMTVFLKYQTWARARDNDMERLCTALLKSGIPELAELVRPTVNLKQLSAQVKERLDEAARNDTPDEEIYPPEVMEALHVSTTRYVQSRTGKNEKVKDEE